MVRLMRSQNHYSKSNQFVVKFMDWDTFFNAMMDRRTHTEVWNQMAQADCIIGGVDTSISYMYVTVMGYIY